MPKLKNNIFDSNKKIKQNTLHFFTFKLAVRSSSQQALVTNPEGSSLHAAIERVAGIEPA
jgi:hypothetical protein